uniref:Uncharacterized protein n=1 Tax=Phlebotomus papatasi TaxID=29031 RepID=A0A1B0CYY6_PHLPP
MTGYTRAEVMQRSASTEFLHGPMTSQLAVNLVREALHKGYEKHFEILYYRKNVIAPIRSEADDISLYIINFEDLTLPQQNESLETRFSKFDRARASFRQSLKFGSMGLRDRGLRLAGYLTPPPMLPRKRRRFTKKGLSMLFREIFQPSFVRTYKAEIYEQGIWDTGQSTSGGLSNCGFRTELEKRECDSGAESRVRIPTIPIPAVVLHAIK